MIHYGDAISYCVCHNVVFRFVERRERSQFVLMNESVPGTHALELAITIDGKNYVAHSPLDSSSDPSRAVAVSLITCVEHFIKRDSRMITGALN